MTVVEGRRKRRGARVMVVVTKVKGWRRKEVRGRRRRQGTMKRTMNQTILIVCGASVISLTMTGEICVVVLLCHYKEAIGSDVQLHH